MARASIWQKPFNRDATFIVHKPFTANGQNFRPGDVFDPALVTTRRLRCMYDMRKLRMEDPAQDLARPPQPAANANADPKVDPDRLPEGMQVKHVGKGKYRVIFDGRILSGTLTEEEARAHAHSLAREYAALAA